MGPQGVCGVTCAHRGRVPGWVGEGANQAPPEPQRGGHIRAGARHRPPWPSLPLPVSGHLP